jgi:hypothetical protein
MSSFSTLCPDVDRTFFADKDVDPSTNDSKFKINGESKGILPSDYFPDSDRDSTGQLKVDIVNTRIQSLENAKLIPALEIELKNSDTITYMENVQNFLTNSKDEICHNYQRYKYSLYRLIGIIAETTKSNTAAQQVALEKYNKYSIQYNKNLNDLIQILNEIITRLLGKSVRLKQEIKTYNDEINALKTKIENQNNIIRSTESVTKLKKEMVKYTEEKGRYTNNLLNLYSFLNVVALGLLVYIYKASDS